jgi:hypothetical protein
MSTTLFCWLRIGQRLEFVVLVLVPFVVTVAASVGPARNLARREMNRINLEGGMYQHSGDHSDHVELDEKMNVIRVGTCPTCTDRHPTPYVGIHHSAGKWEEVLWPTLPDATRQEAQRQLDLQKSHPRYRALRSSFQQLTKAAPQRPQG